MFPKKFFYEDTIYKGRKILKKIFFYHTLLQIACKEGNLEIVKYLTSLGDKIDYKDKDILIILNCLYNLLSNFFNHILYILFYSSSFDAFSFHETALFYAVESGNVELVKYLISLNKFDINDKNIFYFNFLMKFQMLKKFIAFFCFVLFLKFQKSLN